MAKTLKFVESFAIENRESQGFSFKESASKGKAALYPKIEAIHAGTTANWTTYNEGHLQGNMDNHSGVYSWTYPYPKPILKNHDTWEEPLGRVESAQFITDSLTGKSAIVVVPKITDPDAIEKILDGRYLTVSIGGETDSAVCSICGQDIINEGWCDHNKGQKYDVKGKQVTCTWLIGETWFHELSFVNVPADEHAQVVASGNVAMLECYSYDGENIVDLKTSKTLTMEQARLEGININEFKGGNSKVKKLEELQAELETATTSLQTALTEKTALEGTVAQLQTDVTEARDTVQSLEEKNNELTQANTTLNESVVALTQEKETLTASVEGLSAEKQSLMEKNSDMATELHKSLVERVVDLKRSYGKPGCEDREAAITEHMERSEESLKDSLVDLLKEGSTFVFKSQTITPPGVIASKDTQGTVIETKKEEEKETKTLTNEDIFRGLLTKSTKM